MITEEQIWNYLDGNLNVEQRAELEQTIAANQQSADLFREISAIHGALKTDLLVQPSSVFTGKVMYALNIETATKLSPRLIFLFSLPMLLVIVAFAGFIAYKHIPLSYNFPFHFSMPVFNHMGMYFILVDILLLAFVADTFSEYRFNRKALFS